MIKKHIPNTLTSLNLLSGCIGVTLAFEQQLSLAAIMIWIGAGFDFFDGFVARLLNVSSPIGKQLDSLADMITFSLLPAAIMYNIMLPVSPDKWWAMLAFVIAIFSALRLAKFNIDERQSDTFYGIPTPASALFISALPFILLKNHFGMAPIFEQYWVLAIISIALSIMMVLDIKLLALKFKGFQWKGNSFRYILIAISVLLILTLKLASFPFIIIFYVLLSLVNNMLEKSR